MGFLWRLLCKKKNKYVFECWLKAVVLKDAWARIEAHGRELRHMGAHGVAWARSPAPSTID